MERKDQVARGKHSLVESSPKSSSATVPPDVMRLAPEVLAYCLTNERNFYRQDVVRRNKQEGSLGVVMEVAGDLDSEGSTTDGSNIDDADVSKVHDCINDGADRNGEMSDGDLSTLPDGQVRIAWTDGSESTDNVNGITVVDRGFLHGDIVASASDPTGQLGLVVDVSIRIDLQTSNGKMIHNLTSKELKRIREFSIGDYVVWGPWLGRVNDVVDNVTVLFEDGSVCKVVKADPLRLKAVSRPVIDDANCPYYPGQRVRATSSVFRSSRWLSGFWKAGRNEGTVIKVQTASVIVYWMSSAYPCIGTTSGVPSEEQNPNDLTLLSCFSYANWQLGDWCLLQPSVAIKTVDTGNVQETEAECGATCPEESLMDDSSFYDSMPRTTRIEQVLEVPNLSEGHQSSDPECTMLVVDSKNNQITETVGYDSVDHLVPEQILDCHTQNSFQSITESIKGVTNPTETIPVLQECGSCNITPSISREPSHDGWPTYRKKLRKVLLKRERKACQKDENFERALLIVNTVTKVDVAWQDGTREYGLDSICLIPINTPSDQEFFPEQYVLEKNSNEDDESVESNRVGIVRSVNSKDRTVCVRWFKPVSSPEDLREFSRDEIVSVYELDEHPDYDYCYGDVVVRLSPVSTSDSYLKIPPAILGEQIDVTESETAVTKHSEHKLELSEGEPSGKFRSLSWVGNITGLQDGDIEVAWADGMVSKVGPQAVYVVGREDDADSYGDGSDISDDNASWETVDENEMDMLHDAEEEADSQCEKNILACEKAEDNPSEDIVPGKKGAFSASLAAINFVTRLATRLFSRNKRNSDLSNSENNALCGSEAHDVFEVAINLETDADLDISKHKSQGRSTSDAERIFAQQIESLASDASSVKGESEAFLHSFRHFDICDSPADHYYLSSIGQGIGGRKWVKRIQHEWGILEKNLPDAIFVVVYEDRMDLLRAVIIGASGTPYQDGLFFFDFHFPPDYPQVPPLAYYHSGGLRINPNLYVDGKVCLSLLNTWAGRGNEVWDSSSSSILQVLVSLQGLVLNSKPYFNEAGYEKQVGTIEGEKNSVPYNENTYLLNLKSMMYMLRRPPMHFEGFVKDHFLRRGYYILKACEAYMGGCLIGTVTKDANITTEEKKVQFSSVGFKLMLVKILPRLVSALTDTGVDTHQFSHMIRPGYYH